MILQENDLEIHLEIHDLEIQRYKIIIFIFHLENRMDGAETILYDRITIQNDWTTETETREIDSSELASQNAVKGFLKAKLQFISP